MTLFNLIAQSIKIPGHDPITGPLPAEKASEFSTLGGLITSSLNLFFLLCSFLTFFWLVWGVFQYIFAGGDKGALAKARGRITWAIVGLLFLAISFALAQYVERLVKPKLPSSITPAGSFYLVQPVHAAEIDIAKEYGFGHINTLAEGVALLTMPAFSLAATAVVFYLIIGGVKYLMAGGSKEAISSARQMITHSIIGFLLLMLLFIILQFIPQFFGLNFAVISGTPK
jgi:hypothetical protein